MDKITHKVRCEQWISIIKECLASGMPKTTWCREHGISDKAFFTGEYSCAMKSHFRKFGNQMSGSGNHLCKYTSLLA